MTAFRVCLAAAVLATAALGMQAFQCTDFDCRVGCVPFEVKVGAGCVRKTTSFPGGMVQTLDMDLTCQKAVYKMPGATNLFNLVGPRWLYNAGGTAPPNKTCSGVASGVTVALAGACSSVLPTGKNFSSSYFLNCTA
jgi:hypothetical protein